MAQDDSKYTKPGLRESIKKRITAGSKGGKPGQWSARKAQMVAAEYKKKGGGKHMVNEVYKMIKNSNHLSRLVTLSPLTDMARKFHLKNGAKEVQVNLTTQNFEYDIYVIMKFTEKFDVTGFSNAMSAGRLRYKVAFGKINISQ